MQLLKTWVKTALLVVMISPLTFARVPWSVIEQNLRDSGGDLKALSHMKCFIEEQSNRSFQTKRPERKYEDDRCYSRDSLELSDNRFMTLIDYMSPSSKRRMFLIDLVSGSVSAMGVAHGRYQSGFMRLRLKENKNSVKWARYFSNEPGSNAPSSGFFFAGQEYEGKFGRSLILHGLEEDINDNACERAVVIHKHLMVSKRRAYVMSSGCPMVSWSNIDRVINALKGRQQGIKLTEPGGLVFIYGTRESEWAYGSCSI
ncbi:MAG: murein L,D-transpeptidase catalytic domain family protein [Bacteriovoracaceae bacterium]|nr:murein L,D-transpeptidase catalytic domain family protein [Bacteriovoracaceae bacterium]